MLPGGDRSFERVKKAYFLSQHTSFGVVEWSVKARQDLLCPQHARFSVVERSVKGRQGLFGGSSRPLWASLGLSVLFLVYWSGQSRGPTVVSYHLPETDLA